MSLNDVWSHDRAKPEQPGTLDDLHCVSFFFGNHQHLLGPPEYDERPSRQRTDGTGSAPDEGSRRWQVGVVAPPSRFD